MTFLLLSLMGSAFFGYQAYDSSQKIQKEEYRYRQDRERQEYELELDRSKREHELQLEKKKFIYSIILAVLTALLGLGVEVCKANLNKNSDSKPESKITPKISPKTPSKSPKPNISPKLSLCSGNDKLISNWKPGQQHPNYPNVIANEKPGIWIPKTGYEFVTNGNKCDLQVRPKKK